MNLTHFRLLPIILFISWFFLPLLFPDTCGTGVRAQVNGPVWQFGPMATGGLTYVRGSNSSAPADYPETFAYGAGITARATLEDGYSPYAVRGQLSYLTSSTNLTIEEGPRLTRSERTTFQEYTTGRVLLDVMVEYHFGKSFYRNVYVSFGGTTGIAVKHEFTQRISSVISGQTFVSADIYEDTPGGWLIGANAGVGGRLGPVDLTLRVVYAGQARSGKSTAPIIFKDGRVPEYNILLSTAYLF